MNNPKTMLLGWGSLILVAGGSYIYARKDINERRRHQAAEGARPTEIMDWKARIGSHAQQADGGPTSHPSPPPSGAIKPT